MTNETKSSEIEFRKELVKLMPGFKWTIHRSISGKILNASGIQSSGFNRIATIKVSWWKDGKWYEVAGSGYGPHSAEMGRSSGSSLAQALRGLQDHYRNMAGKYSALESGMAEARKIVSKEQPIQAAPAAEPP